MLHPPARVTSLALALLITSTSLLGQSTDLKSQALAAFSEENYTRAIELIRLAMTGNPTDGENFYHLARFLQQECVNAVPGPECGRAKSDEIIRYLDEGLLRNPTLADSYYYLALEYGNRAREDFLGGNIAGALEQLRLARSRNALPDWLIEYAKNVLRSCEQSAILFVNGDIEATALFYAQAIDRLRTDVTVIPIPLLNQPLYVATLKKGIRDYLVPAPINWSEQQILAGRPYNLLTRSFELPGLGGQTLTVPVTGDVTAESRSHLSLAKATLIEIIRTNRWRRSIHFSLAAPVWCYTDLSRSLEIFGLTLRFVPVAWSGQGFVVNAGPTEFVLLDATNFSSLTTLRERRIPLASSLLNAYRDVYLQLIQSHLANQRPDEARRALNAMDTFVPSTLIPLSEAWIDYVAGLRQRLAQ